MYTMTDAPELTEANCALLNGQFYDAQPWIYFQQRLAHLMFAASDGDRYRAIFANGVTAGGVTLKIDVNPAAIDLPTPEQSFTALSLGPCPSPQSGRGIGRSGAGGSAGFARGRHPGGPDRARSRPATPALPARDAELLTPATDAALPAPAPRGSVAAPPAHRRDSAAAAWTVTRCAS